MERLWLDGQKGKQVDGPKSANSVRPLRLEVKDEFLPGKAALAKG